jgi:hypothetical protein
MDKTMPNGDIRVSGGDRYLDRDGNVRSATNNKVVPGSRYTSPHLYENGARAVDIYVPGASDKEIKDAAKRAGFPEYNTKQDYDDGHTHINLPNTPDNYYKRISECR